MTTPHLPEAPADWQQINLWCPTWQAAEELGATVLGPRLIEAEEAGLLSGWWFTRKQRCWRVRYRPHPGNEEQVRDLVEDVLRTLTNGDAIERWNRAVYEPETHAFGGSAGMEIAHTLFTADSHHLLAHLCGHGGQHRAELGVLHASALMRGAGQDWYEQGDVFASVAAHRDADRDPTAAEVESVRRLMTARTATITNSVWAGAFNDAGAVLAGLAQEGHLSRGLRATLAHHVLFAFNRAGIPARRQALLAQAATVCVFHHEPAQATRPARSSVPSEPTSLTEVNTTANAPDETGISQLRAGLVDHIRTRGTFRTAAVESAFQTVPRHLFLPGVDPKTAYAPQQVVTKRAADGSALSSASSPNLVAGMLEQLQVRPGQRVLEIGAATGINAALLAELVGEAGSVTTVELDQDLADGARTALTTAGYDRVHVVCGDGALGHPAGAPYDRIIVTAGAAEISSAWWDQLAVGGRMVAPLRLHGSGLTRSLAFDRTDDTSMVATDALVCGFVPLRGTSRATAGRSVQLAEDVQLTLAADDSGTDALAHVLTHPAHEVWPDIVLGDEEPVAHLDLWLTTATAHFARLSVGPEARDSGCVTPALRWAGAALHDGAGTLAYLTLRPAGEHADELGVTAHGPDAPAFAARTSDLLHRWRAERPGHPTVTAHPAGTPEELPEGYRVTTPDTTLTITW